MIRVSAIELDNRKQSYINEYKALGCNRLEAVHLAHLMQVEDIKDMLAGHELRVQKVGNF